ncbi:MAG: sigma-70 family RNA polymerase sigma factor [Acidobacteria bacterium]|nr:sigma-70 family RNA polymerase sigma factor [Acidobacteriota bacterium]
MLAAVASDIELMVGVKAGDDACFAELLNRYRDPIVRYLYRMVQNREIAEELAQEVFVRIYLSRARYEPTAKFSGWIYRIATNLVFNWIRNHRRERGQDSVDALAARGVRRPLADPRSRIDETLLGEVMRTEVRRAIAALPERQRVVVLLHKYDELGYDQIARSLGCSVQAVKSLMFRAHENLRTQLAHLAPEA